MQQNTNPELAEQVQASNRELQAALARIQQQVQQAETINQIVQVISRQVELDEVLQTAVDLLAQTLEVSHCLILQPNSDLVPRLRCVSQAVLEPGAYCELYHHWGAVLAQGQPVVIPRLEETRLFLEIQSDAQVDLVHSILIVPILLQQSHWGGILLHQRKQEREWTNDEMAFVQSVANLCVLAIQQAELAITLQTERMARQQAQQEPDQGEQEFRALAENSPDLITRFDRQLRHLYVNAAIEPVTGLSPQDFIGKTNQELGMPEALCTFWEENFQQVFTTGQKHTIEFDFLTADGTTRNYQSRIVPEFARDGSVESLLVVARDVTDFKQTEAALRESQQLLQGILDAAPTRIYLKDLQGQYILVNRCCEGMLGLSQEQVIGKTDYDIWSREIADAFRASDQAVLEAGMPLEWEQVAEEVGKFYTFITIKFPLYDAAGTPYAIGGISTDITERKQIETALRESEERFRQLAENINAVFWMRSLDEQFNKQEFLYISPAYEKIWGRTRESLYEQLNSWLDAVYPEDLPKLITLIEQQRQGEFPERVYRIVLPDGSIRWIQDRTFPVHNDQGRVYRVAGICEDITPAKQAETAIKESEERFRQLAENIDAVFWIFSVNQQKTLYISPAYEKIWGRSSQPLYENSQNWMETIYPEDHPLAISRYERLKQGEPVEDVYRIVKPDGSVRWINDHAFPIYDSEGRLYRAAGIAQDITERKQAEEQLRASLREKEALLMEVHHRVKNNLQIISSLLDLQSQHLQEPLALEAFQTSQNRIKSIALIHEKLYQSENLARVNLADYIHSLVINLLQTYTTNPDNITLQLNVANISLNLDTLIPCGLIINELVSNALKHGLSENTKGKIWVDINSISAASFKENVQQVTLVVGNEGKKFQNPFDFKNLKSLGLQLVNVLVEQLQGKIELDQSRGTEFKISFLDQNSLVKS